MSAVDKRELLSEFARALRDDTAAVFVGAGLSVAAGYVDWRRLLKEIAEDLELDVAREPDLVALAQFHVNHRGGRDRINQLLIDHFLEDAALTENHRLIASLPVRSVWTTNYDDMLEKAFEAAEKRVDVKRRETDFASSKRHIDVTVFKMHGDRTDPAEAILTKEDYETYHTSRELFTIAFKGDLVKRTFLFLGFSFTDRNIGYLLGRVKQLLEGNKRQHYCLLKRPKSGECGDDDYSCTRFTHWLADLRRYGIMPVLIDSYAEVTDLLRALNRRAHLHDVFIAGSAADFGPLGEAKFKELCTLLGSELIKRNFNIVSGFGLGVGDMIIAGALSNLRRNDDERLQLWPFPQSVPAGEDRSEFWRKYRERILANAGICVVVSGNKADGERIVEANGVRQEVEIARSLGRAIIPVGATGHVARSVWEEVSRAPTDYYGAVGVEDQLVILGREGASPVDLVQAVVEIARRLNR